MASCLLFDFTYLNRKNNKRYALKIKAYLATLFKTKKSGLLTCEIASKLTKVTDLVSKEQMRIFDYIVGFCAILSLLVSYRSARYQRKKKLKCESSLKLNNALARIKIRNTGVPNITIENVALSLIVWDSSPWLQLEGVALILQVIEKRWNYQRDQIYVSKSQINSPSNSNGSTPNEGAL